MFGRMFGVCAYLATGVCTRTHHDTIPDVDLILIVLVLASFSLAQSTDTAPQSITAQPLYASQKPCAQQCFFPNYLACPVDAVASAIGCQYGNCPQVFKTVSYEAANNC